MSFLRNNRGSPESISFLFAVSVLMFIVVNLLPPAITLIKYMQISKVHRETLLRMEIAGGLTPEIEQRALDSLAEHGFNPNDVSITGTPAANYGQTVQLRIQYTYTYRDYAFRNFLLYPVDKPRTIVVDGSSISFAFHK